MENNKEIILSDGRKAIIRKGKVKDMISAYDKASNPNNQMDSTIALIATLTTVDGKPLIYEEFKEMDMEDGNLIIMEFATMGKSMERLEKLLNSPNTPVGE